MKKLQSQNSVLREKTIDIRRENDLLVDKVQKLQVSEEEELETVFQFQFVRSD